MYHKERIDKFMEVNNKTIQNFKLNLLRMLFSFRAEDGLDDTNILQTIIDDGYLTVDEILAEKNNIRIIAESLSPFYSNIINAVTKKAIKDDIVLNILVQYFNDIYRSCHIDQSNSFNLSKPSVKKFINGMLQPAEACFVSFLMLCVTGNDRKRFIQVRDLCNEQGIVNPMQDVRQFTILETISDFLDYDMVKAEGFTERFINRRKNELFEYLLKQAKVNVKTEVFTDDEIYTAICAASFGAVSSNVFQGTKYSSLVERGLFKPLDIGLADDLSIQFLGPLGKIGVNSASLIASQTLKAEYGQIHYLRNLTGAIIAEENLNQSFVKSAILEYLLDVLSYAYFSIEKEKYTHEQIIRQLSYSETDCRIVFEKVAAAIQFYMISNHLRKMIDSSIIYGDYGNIKASTQRQVSSNNSKSSQNKTISKSIKQTTQKKIIDINAALDAEVKKSSLLESENIKLRDEISKLRNAVGEILVENLPFGHFRWNELVPPVGYEKCEPVEFVINAENAGTTITTRISDAEKKGMVKLVKKSTEGLYLKGAVYSVYTSEDELVRDGLFTDEFGETPVVSGLDWGEFYFKEDKAPNGYLLSNEKIRFTINARTSEYIQVVEATDEQQLGTVKLTKTNKYTNEEDKILLEGAIFNLYKSNGTLVKENLTTDQNGEIEVSNLEWNNYYFAEMKAPESYSVSSEKIRFSINASNVSKIQEVTCIDEQGMCEIKVNKEINEQYAPFGDATFIFEVSGTDVEGKEHRYTKSLVVSNGQTSGNVVFSKIPAGTYQVCEKNVARYKQTGVFPIEGIVSTENITIDGVLKSVANVNLTSSSYAELKFTNNLRQYEKLSHNNLVVNVLNTSRKLIGISVDYKGANPISSSTSSIYTFKESDLEITAYYDNDTTEILSFTDVELSPYTITSYENSTGVGYTVGVSYSENGIVAEDSFNVQLNLKPLPPRSRVLFDANSGYFNNNGSSLLNVSSYKYGSAANRVIEGLYEEPQNGTKMFLNWYTTQDFQEGTEVLVAATDCDNPEENVILYTDLEGNPIQFNDDVTLYAKWSEEGNLVKSGSCGANATYKLYDNGLMLIEGSGSINYSIPNKNSIKKVIISEGITEIAQYTFSDCKNLSSVLFPSTLTKIGFYAFNNCSNIKNITIPNSATSIDSYAFYSYNYPTNAINIVLPVISNSSSHIGNTRARNVILTGSTSPRFSGNSCSENIILPVGLTSLGEYALNGCSVLSEIIIPEGVTSIGNYAFQNCAGLTGINITDNVTAIGDYAFYGCNNLREVIIPDGMSSIGNWTFRGCKSLTEITIPESVTTIGDGAFCDCTSLNNVTIPESLTSIGRSTFSSCKGLTSISIPKSVTSIGNYAFSGCTGLTEISIPDSVTSIGDYAFQECTSLTEIAIPDSVTTIGGYTFSNCSSLTYAYIGSGLSSMKYEYALFNKCDNLEVIEISEDNPYYDSRANCNAIIRTKDNILVYGCAGTVIPDTVTSIANYSFYYNPNIKDVYIPASVKSISSETFIVCENIESIEVDKNNTTFDSRDNCNAIIQTSSDSLVKGCKNTVIPNGVRTIRTRAFYGCKELKRINIPESISTIEYYSFASTGLTEISIPESVTGIGWNAFTGCTDLTKANIPASVNTIYGETFMGCSNLTDVTLGEGITAITSGMFKNCYSLNSLTIPNSVKSINKEAFSNCWSLESINIPTGVTVIGEYAFNGCTSLTEITLPEGLTSIGNYAFQSCTGLTEINIPDNVTTIGNYAFASCDSLTKVVIGSGVTSMASNSFYRCKNLEMDCNKNEYAEQWCLNNGYTQLSEHVYKAR